MSESEYKDLVLADYDEKAVNLPLPAELLMPTPGNIKAELVKICERGLSTDDQGILRSFVGKKSDAAAYRMAILNGKADPFRSLERLLDKREVNTHIRNINLLALLIDYKVRPYHPNLQVPGSKPATDVKATESQSEPQTEPQPVTANQDAPPLGNNGIITGPPAADTPKVMTEKTGSGTAGTNRRQSHKNINKRVLLFISILLLGVGAGVYTYWHKEIKPYTGHEKCMIWNNDRYEPVECNTTTASQSYPINWLWVKHFRRITTPDTLTLYSIGKVWYANYKGRMEFFNDSAAFPQDTNRRLLPMTDHILKKYIYHITN